MTKVQLDADVYLEYQIKNMVLKVLQKRDLIDRCPDIKNCFAVYTI